MIEEVPVALAAAAVIRENDHYALSLQNRMLNRELHVTFRSALEELDAIDSESNCY